jgi:plastocyanin
MRFLGFAVLTSAVIALSACGGDKTAATDSAAGASAAAAAAATTPAAPAATGAAGAMAPITGTTHEVRMVGDASGYKFEPAEITIKQGDGIRWTMVSGGPHNVAFDATKLTPEAKAALLANMPEQMAELMGKNLLNANETYTISFANVPAGTYEYNCTPHLAMGMIGKITIQ